MVSLSLSSLSSRTCFSNWIILVIFTINFYYYDYDNCCSSSSSGMVSAFSIVRQSSTISSTTTTTTTRRRLLTSSIVSSAATTSSSSTSVTSAEENYRKIRTALISASGKLTFSPEIIIPEPKDPTALLLLGSSIETLSKRVRTGQANVMLIQSTLLSSLQLITTEQQSAFGNFPNPVPVIYYPSATTNYNDNELLQEIANVGVQGIVVPVTYQKDGTLNDIEQWQSVRQQSYELGIQAIPEIIIPQQLAKSLTETSIESFVTTLSSSNEEELVACIFTIQPNDESVAIVDDDTDDDDDDILTPKLVTNEQTVTTEETNTKESTIDLPTIPKTLGKKIPILGSVRSIAGDNRLSTEAAELKKLGYTGVILRYNCIPGYQIIQLDLDIISQFWSACITDLKSLKSKNFGGFRAKNNMDMTSADKWIRYRKSVLESGALGDPNDNSSLGGMDTSAGDYQGFA